MTYDMARQRTLLFGGNPGSAIYLNDTWEWDGQSWIQVAEIGPTGRYNHKMIYDSTRERIVLYGGRIVENGTNTNETWEWNGTEWMQIADTGPLFQNGSTAMGYDKGRQRIVLLGHLDEIRNETWEWDGNGWTQKSDNGPSARYFSTMAYDDRRQCMVLFGGALKDGNSLDDTWEWDGASWKQRADFGPSARSEHAMAFDDDRKCVVLFGGLRTAPAGGAVDKPILGDTWEWDGSRWIQRLNMGPTTRCNHSLAYDSSRKRIVLFGGKFAASLLGDTWEFAEQTSN
jgi:hypothetical protein